VGSWWPAVLLGRGGLCRGGAGVWWFSWTRYAGVRMKGAGQTWMAGDAKPKRQKEVRRVPAASGSERPKPQTDHRVDATTVRRNSVSSSSASRHVGCCRGTSTRSLRCKSSRNSPAASGLEYSGAGIAVITSSDRASRWSWRAGRWKFRWRVVIDVPGSCTTSRRYAARRIAPVSIWRGVSRQCAVQPQHLLHSRWSQGPVRPSARGSQGCALPLPSSIPPSSAEAPPFDVDLPPPGPRVGLYHRCQQ